MVRLASAIAASLALTPTHAAPVADVEFSDGFLLGGSAIDVSRYVQGNPVAAGEYAVDVLLNDAFLQQADIAFIAGDDPLDAQPCLPASLLPPLGLGVQYLEAGAEEQGTCVDLPTRVPGATVTFDSSTLQLRLTVPQAAQERLPRGHVPAARRDAGVTAAFVDYAANHYSSQGRQHGHLGLRAGVNLGHWRLRHRASITQGAAGLRSRTLGSDLQRDLPGWNSQLLLGQGSTGGELFESLRFTGVRVATDERMLPDSLRGFAPVVQGIAEGNAVVSIRQNGTVIHESTVAPGPFVIDDLYPTSFGGDLQVTVTEADGRSRRYTVNFSAVPQALRAGSSRFSATAGHLRDDGARLRRLPFAEGTYAHGISNHLTLLGGAQVAQHYQAALLGAAVNTPVGAFGADITHSRARPGTGEQVHGNSYRLNYQRYLAGSGTHVGLAAYRFSTRGFRTLNDTAARADDAWVDTGRTRQRYQMNLSQRLGERTSLQLSGGHVAYWDSGQRRNDVQLALQTSWRRANVGVSVQRYRSERGDQDTRYALNVSVPLGTAPQSPRLSTQLSHSPRTDQAQLSLNGTLGAQRNTHYSLSAGHGSDGVHSQSAYVGHQGAYGHFNAGYSHAAGQRSQTLGASGSVVLHRGGVNFGPPLGNGFALVQAKGAEGARIGAGHSVRVGRNGYALLPHITPYRWNQIDLDPAGLPLDVDVLQTSHRIAPTAGGIVRVAFEVRRERTLFIDATDALGQPLPFAARIVDEAGQSRGAVGQGSVIQLRGAQEAGALIVDPEGPARCRLDYQLLDAPDAYGLSWTQAQCLPHPPLPAALQVNARQLHAEPTDHDGQAATPR